MLTSVISKGMCSPATSTQLPIGITAMELTAQITDSIGAAM